MMGYTAGQQVRTPDGTRATFVKYLASPHGGRSAQAIIAVGTDTRVVDPITLKGA